MFYFAAIQVEHNVSYLAAANRTTASNATANSDRSIARLVYFSVVCKQIYLLSSHYVWGGNGNKYNHPHQVRKTLQTHQFLVFFWSFADLRPKCWSIYQR